MNPEDRGRGTVSRRSLLLGGLAAVAVAGAAGVGFATRGGSPEQQGSPETGGSGAASADGVVFTTTGATFSPVLELAPGSDAEVVWLDEAGSELARGASPTIELGSPTTRDITLQTRFEDVVTVNLGFSSQDDAGRYSLKAEYDKPPEEVVAVSGLTLLTGLRRFLAAHGPLAGALDLAGLASLENVECFGAKVESVDLTGCTSVLRLCLEETALTALDLNPVAGSLRDLRAAAQQGGALELTPLEAPLAQLYHFCVRDQTVTGHPTSDQLPACEELWNWSAGQVGALPAPGSARSVMAAGNGYTSADLSGQWQYDGGWGLLDLTGNRLTSLDLTGCHALQTLWLRDNALDQAAVDGVLREVASWRTPGFELTLEGSNAAPSRSGMAHVAELRGRGWKVTVNEAGA